MLTAQDYRARDGILMVMACHLSAEFGGRFGITYGGTKAGVELTLWKGQGAIHGCSIPLKHRDCTLFLKTGNLSPRLARKLREFVKEVKGDLVLEAIERLSV